MPDRKKLDATPITPVHASIGRGLTFVITLAFVVRIAWAALVECHPVSDCAIYDQTARNIVNHGTFGIEAGSPTSFWPPGASVLYAGMYWVFGDSFAPVVAVNIVMSVLVVWLTYELVRLVVNRGTAVWAAGLVAVWPMHVEFTTVLASELPFTLFTLLGMLAWMRFAERPWARVLAAGASFAIAAYMRPTGLLVPVLLAGAEFLLKPNRGRTFLTALGVGALMAAAIAPWTYRNWNLYHLFVPISANSGTNLWMGNNPTATGYYMQYPELPGKSEAEADRERGKLAKEFIAKDPVAFLKRTATKFVLLHKSQTIGVVWNKQGLDDRFPESVVTGIKYAGQVYWLAVLALSFVGSVGLCLRDGFLKTVSSPLVYVWGYFALVYAVWVIQDRYTFPSTPFIAGLAAAGVTVLWEFFFRPSEVVPA